jgi:hypothetical protein
LTRTVYVEPAKADHLMKGARAVLARVPGVAVIGIILYLFIRDPVWPYHLLTNSLITDFMRVLTDAHYRMWWIEHWLALFTVIISLAIILSIAFKMGVWNKAFKTLKVRTREQEDKIETEIGRAYWIEGWSGQSVIRFGKWFIGALHIADIKVANDPKKKYRMMKPSPKLDLAISRADDKIDWVYKQTSSRNGEKTSSILGERRKRTIFYKASFWPPINIISPHRSMHRLVIDLPNENIQVHDGTMIMVEGRNLERDLSEDYPTFELTTDANEFVPLDLKHYKNGMDDDIQKATFTTNIASQMDTFLLKDQRKFQEISVPVNPFMAKLVKETGR